MRIGMFVLVTVIVIAGQSWGVRAEGLKPCIANLVRPGSRMAVDLSTMKPPAECPKTGWLQKFNENALVLKAWGKIKPTFGAVDPEGGDNNGKAPGLILVIVRFDKPVYVAEPTDLAKSQFAAGEIRDLPFEKELPGNPALHARGYAVHDNDSDRDLVCVSASDNGTVTLAIVCRTTSREEESDQLNMLEQMSRDDLGAIRF